MSSPVFPSSGVGGPEIAQIETPGSWRSLIVPAIVVIILLAIAWALFAHYGKPKPDAAGAILSEQVYPVQVDPGGPAGGPGMEGEAAPEQDEVLLLVNVRVTNVSRKPLSIFDIVADVKLNGENAESTAALPEDIDRMYQAFPDLAPTRTPLLTRHETIAPGQSIQGLVVFSYPWSKQQWNTRQDANAVISFDNGRSLVLPLH